MRKLLTLALLLTVTFAVFAQDGEPVAVLEFFDNVDGIFITSADGEDLFPEYGMELLPGDKVETTISTAEIRLDPNQSLIKLATNTQFVVDQLQGRGGSTENAFSLVGGKIRGVFARTPGAQYQIATQTAVCGVRGTKLGMSNIPGESESMILQSGAASFTNLLTGVTLDLDPGQFANALAETFEAVTATAEQMADFFSGIEGFSSPNIDENAVPGNAPEPQVSQPDEGGDTATTEATPVIEPPSDETVTEEVTPEEAAEAGLFDPILDWLRETLGMEIGTITIDDKTYSKALLQPEFTIGKLSMGLYLPIIYETNMFDANDWYHPRGNDEWSFGTDVADGGGWGADPVAAAQDAVSDLFLKIRYLQWGDQRDSFFFKVGNLDNMTVGHGILMRNYANDADFPSVRRIGLNLGIDLGVVGFEAMANDLSELPPEIFGGRFYLRPFGKGAFRPAIGLSSIVDIDPSGELPLADDVTEATGPMFFGAGFDIDLPVIETDFMSIVIFGDVAGMIPYYRSSISNADESITLNGLYTPAVYNANAGEGEFPLQNYGLSAGLFGNIFILDYRLEYRNFNGTFRPAFFGPNYDRLRYAYVDELTQELLNPEEIVPTVGIYGEAGFAIGDKFYLEAGYMWPWTPSSSDQTTEVLGSPGENDELHVKAILEKGLIPVLDIHGSLTYDRTNLVPTLLGEGIPEDVTILQALFDANTSMSGELIYPVAESLDVAILVTTNIAQDDNGDVVMADNGLPEISPSISIETRLHF